MQPRDLLALVKLLFRDFVDRPPQALELRILLRLRLPIGLSKAVELLVLSRQPPLQSCNRRLKPDNFNVRVLRNEFTNPSPELGELEFAAQRSRSIAFSIPISIVAP
jgi:hypothetical protein